MNDDHHTSIYLQLNDYNSILEQSMTLYECLRRCTGICNEPRVTCMKELWTVALPQIQCQLHGHAKQYHNDGACHNKRNGGKLHGNISRNGYGNSIIGRYGGCFEERYKEGLMHRWKLRGTTMASKGGRVRVRIIHGLNISQKNSYTNCKKIYKSSKTKHYVHAPRG